MTVAGQHQGSKQNVWLIRCARVITWIALLGAIFASVLPGAYMPQIGRGLTEHVLAYGCFTAAAALGYGQRLGLPGLLASAMVLAGLLELAQAWIPGRTHSWIDLVAGATGAVCGVSAAYLLRRRRLDTGPPSGN